MKLLKLLILTIVVLLVLVLNNSDFISCETQEQNQLNEIDGDECSGVRCSHLNRLHCLTSRPPGRYIDRKFAKDKYNTVLCCPICILQSGSFCNHTSTSLHDSKLKYLTGNIYTCYSGDEDCNMETNTCETLPQYR